MGFNISAEEIQQAAASDARMEAKKAAFAVDLNRRSIEQLREMILLLEERIQVLERKVHPK